MSVHEILDPRRLNRALLARQHLLARSAMPPLAMIDHLVGLQAQNPWSPYLGLWSRLEGRTTPGFRHDELAELLLSRRAVRIAVMRGTIHLVSAPDALVLPTLMGPVFARALRAGTDWGTALRPWGAGGLAVLAENARAMIAEQPMTPAELGAALAARLAPQAPTMPASALAPSALAQGARSLLPLVQVPPRAVWGRQGATRWTTTGAWLGAEPVDLTSAESRQAALESVALRYLGAFGPASVADLQRWCGLTRMSGVIDGLRPRLVTFRSVEGREIVDLPEAPRPDRDVPAPVRFLPDYDNVLIGHADRSRVISAELRRRLVSANGAVPGTVLVDGRVAACWRISRAGTGSSGAATLTVTALTRLAAHDLDEVHSEADAVVRFMADDADRHEVVVEQTV